MGPGAVVTPTTRAAAGSVAAVVASAPHIVRWRRPAMRRPVVLVVRSSSRASASSVLLVAVAASASRATPRTEGRPLPTAGVIPILWRVGWRRRRWQRGSRTHRAARVARAAAAAGRRGGGRAPGADRALLLAAPGRLAAGGGGPARLVRRGPGRGGDAPRRGGGHPRGVSVLVLQVRVCISPSVAFRRICRPASPVVLAIVVVILIASIATHWRSACASGVIAVVARRHVVLLARRRRPGIWLPALGWCSDWCSTRPPRRATLAISSSGRNSLVIRSRPRVISALARGPLPTVVVPAGAAATAADRRLAPAVAAAGRARLIGRRRRPGVLR